MEENIAPADDKHCRTQGKTPTNSAPTDKQLG